jgi:hypothetical protein
MKMLKYLPLVALLSAAQPVLAQAPNFEDLVILYADGKYDKCVVKADKYTQGDDTKKEPVPYIYASMALFQISKDATWVQKNPEFEDAFKEAIKYAAKFVKLDKDKAYKGEYGEYLDELLFAALEESMNWAAEAKYSKAVGTMKKVCEFAPEDAGAWLLKGVYDFRNKVKADATAAWAKGLPLLETVVFEDLSKAHKKMLKVGIMEYATLQVENKAIDKAKDVMNKGYVWFQEDQEFKEKYDAIVNG